MSLLNRQTLTIIKDYGTDVEERVTVRGFVSGNSAKFPFDTKVYDGDVLERPDPRGGVLLARVQGVTVYDAGSSAVNHIAARLKPL
ncbi:hypothetical protein J7E25_03110 [Agromyces sp. ISL-38]|uniref:hypothetical protein n=1 Tax=Agromyces sp. ISL-38 TaxID=2819107 RepID=UPI001BE796A6|nr:hypothetical protein [Agromyces sp. ISL-38]MBT2498077.1 hypothetical protein [Agromyces sp. ISL-38]